MIDMALGIELITGENGNVVSRGIVLNPLTEKQLTITWNESDRKFIRDCLDSVPGDPLPVYNEDLVVDGKCTPVEDYSKSRGIDGLTFARQYKPGEAPKFADGPMLVGHAAPGSRDFAFALTCYFNGINISGKTVYSTLVL